MFDLIVHRRMVFQSMLFDGMRPYKIVFLMELQCYAVQRHIAIQTQALSKFLLYALEPGIIHKSAFILSLQNIMNTCSSMTYTLRKKGAI